MVDSTLHKNLGSELSMMPNFVLNAAIKQD